SIPIVLAAGPATSSTVAGANGTVVPTEPRVATVAQLALTLVTTTYSPGAALYELVSEEPRRARPRAFTTAMCARGAVEQITARWTVWRPCKPPPGFLVSM